MMSIRSGLRAIGAMVIAVAAASAQAAALMPTITVTPWLAPNAYGSPNWAAAQDNAVQAMYHGVSSYGTPGTPGYFSANSNVTTAEAIVTGFSSWKGKADPGTVFGSAYAGEYGNRMSFAIGINGNGSQFSISQLGFSATSTDPFNALAFSWGPGDYDYGAGYVGVLKGADGILGTADDVFITSGVNTQLVDALFGRGSGNSFAAYCSPCSIAEQQAAIDGSAAYPGQDFTFTGNYTLNNVDGAFTSGSGTFDVRAVPEPASLALASIALLGLAASRRRKSV